MNTPTVKELKEMAKDANITNYKNLKKDELMNELYGDRHYGLILDYMQDYEVSLEVAKDMASE